MTSQEFVQWLKGFTEGVHEYNITPKQWDLLKERLAEVSDEPKVHYPLSTPGTTPYTPSFPPYTDPYNPYRVTCDDYPGVLKADRTKYGTDLPLSGSASIPTIWTSNPNSVTYTVTTGSSYSGVGTYTYPNGTTVSYTTGGDMLGIKDFSPSDKLNIGGQTTDKTLLND